MKNGKNMQNKKATTKTTPAVKSQKQVKPDATVKTKAVKAKPAKQKVARKAKGPKAKPIFNKSAVVKWLNATVATTMKAIQAAKAEKFPAALALITSAMDVGQDAENELQTHKNEFAAA